jgi:hypothetical protein
MEIPEIILTAKRSGEPSSPVLTMVRRKKLVKQGDGNPRDNFDSEEEWRAIITSTDNDKKEKMG